MSRNNMAAIYSEIENINTIARHMNNILTNMLKIVINAFKDESEEHCKLFDTSIINGISSIEEILKKSPSLKHYPSQVMEECYQQSVRECSKQSGIAVRIFPKECPWTIEEVLEKIKS